ncbi:hypothetical protein [Sphingomonas sp. TF3]|uniref:hypothetical protein n=1 Tax=Sphingomonas sp. TF3 TaxID=2495580 RepID=UPI000F86B3ED|nr:hypothetical protein [Sphingomonas sp. TF3]
MTPPLRVPTALLNYLARRCDAPAGLIATVLKLSSPGRSHCIPASGDPHNNLRPCVLNATTIIASRGQDIEATIIGDGWAVHADSTHTDLTLAVLPHVARASTGRGLLCDKFDFAFLPRELEIEAIIDRGAGALIRCQPLTTLLATTHKAPDEGLNDVCGAVSGSDGAS